ncbi:MAG: hypothetical protein ABIE55_01905 [Candidatus Aenigmatarchaeota archaeon]
MEQKIFKLKNLNYGRLFLSPESDIMTTWDKLVKGLAKKSFEINELRKDLTEEDFKKYCKKIERFYTSNRYSGENNSTPNLVSYKTLRDFKEKHAITTVIHDYGSIIDFCYPNDLNGGETVCRPFLYAGVFTQKYKPEPETPTIELSELEDWGIMTGNVASGEILEKPKNLSESVKKINKQIVRELLEMNLIIN